VRRGEEGKVRGGHAVGGTKGSKIKKKVVGTLGGRGRRGELKTRKKKKMSTM